MAAVLVGLGIFVYFRVDSALLRSVDDSLRAQAGDSSQHVHGGSLIDPDVGESGTVVEVIDANGRVIRSAPTGLPPLIDRRTLQPCPDGEGDRDRVPRAGRVE